MTADSDIAVMRKADYTESRAEDGEVLFGAVTRSNISNGARVAQHRNNDSDASSPCRRRHAPPHFVEEVEEEGHLDRAPFPHLLRISAHDGRLAATFNPRPHFGRLTATATREAGARFMATWYRRTYGRGGVSSRYAG